MSDIDKLVENYFRPKNTLGFDTLLQLIEETVSSLSFVREDMKELDTSEEKDINISFPKIRISEDFGKIGTEDRAMIEKFASNIPGDTLEAKLAALNDILETKKESATIGEILSTMVMCEILSAIITNFTESAGGFIFEGFLAGLFGGKSVQITKPEDIEGMAAAGKPITDVVLGDKHYSLKLLGEDTEVKGSFRNMVEHFKVIDHIVYLDARRVGKDQGLEFGEFIITLENFLEVFVTPFLKTVTVKEPTIKTDAKEFKKYLSALISNKQAIKAIKTTKQIPGLPSNDFVFSPSQEEQLQERRMRVNAEDMNKVINVILNTPTEELAEYGPDFEVKYAAAKFEGTKAEKLFGSYAVVQQLQRAIESGNRDAILASLEKTPGYIDPQQFKFTRNQAEEIENFKTIGTLMIGPEYMKKTFANYANLLQQTISPVYEQLQLFTDNINDYFLGVTGEGAEQNRKQYALDAINNAQQLEVATNNAVEKIEKQLDIPYNFCYTIRVNFTQERCACPVNMNLERIYNKKY